MRYLRNAIQFAQAAMDDQAEAACFGADGVFTPGKRVAAARIWLRARIAANAAIRANIVSNLALKGIGAIVIDVCGGTPVQTGGWWVWPESTGGRTGPVDG